MPRGTLGRRDTLASLRVTNGTVAEYGVDRFFELVEDYVVVMENILRDMLADFCDFGTIRLMRYGAGVTDFTMEKLNEYGRADAAKVGSGSDVGFPLERWGKSLSWTEDFILTSEVKELAAMVMAIVGADMANVILHIKRALYYSTNSTETDYLLDKASIPIKRLANADSMALPINPMTGATFNAATHTHYSANATLTSTVLNNLMTNVTEHFASGTVGYIDINTAQESFFDPTSLTGYVQLPYTGQTLGDDTARANGAPLSPFGTLDRVIGNYKGWIVRVKPYSIANYVLCHVQGPAIEKILQYRYRGAKSDGQGSSLPGIMNGGSLTQTGWGDLQLVSRDKNFQMALEEYRREFGLGVKNRVAGAILYIGGGSYVDPSL